MRIVELAALLLLVCSSCLSFEARAELTRIVVAPAAYSAHDYIDPSDPLSDLAVSAYSLRCHRPGRLAREAQPPPVPDGRARFSPLLRPPLVPSSGRFRAIRALERPGVTSHPDAERAPPV